MKAFDCVNKQEVEVTKEGLIDFIDVYKRQIYNYINDGQNLNDTSE